MALLQDTVAPLLQDTVAPLAQQRVAHDRWGQPRRRSRVALLPHPRDPAPPPSVEVRGSGALARALPTWNRRGDRTEPRPTAASAAGSTARATGPVDLTASSC